MPYGAQSIHNTQDVINLTVEARSFQHPTINIKKPTSECIATHNFSSKLQLNLKEIVPRKIDSHAMKIAFNSGGRDSMSKKVLVLDLNQRQRSRNVKTPCPALGLLKAETNCDKFTVGENGFAESGNDVLAVQVQQALMVGFTFY